MSTYRIPPGMRFAFDTDGTRVFRTTAAHGWAELPKNLLPHLLYGDSGVYWRPDKTETNKLTLFFPEQRDILGVFLACTFNATGSYPYSYTVGGNKDYNSNVKDYPIRCETSTDTTDGINGSWNQTSFIHGNPRAILASTSTLPFPSPYQQGYYMNASARLHRVSGEANVGFSSYGGRAIMTYRTGAADLHSDVGPGPVPLSGFSTGVRALRIWLETYNSSTGKYEFQDSMFLQMLHVYGKVSLNGISTQLVAWHATDNRPLTHADTDQGNTRQGSTGIIQFRIKNTSPSKTARFPSAYVDVPFVRTSPPLHSDVHVSLDGSSYTESCTVDDLAPGHISPIITVRRITPKDAAMGVASFRIGMSVRGWED